MEIKLYADRCLTCDESLRISTLSYYAKQNGMKVVQRRVYVFPELQEEADVFGEQMPFISLGDRTYDFYKINKNILKEEHLDKWLKNEEENE